MQDAHYGIEVSLILLGISGWLGGASWKHMKLCLPFLLGHTVNRGKVYILLWLLFLCQCCSWQWQKLCWCPASACSHCSRGCAQDWLRKQGWANKHGKALPWVRQCCLQSSVRVKHRWMRELVSLHQHGAAAQVSTGQWWAPTSEHECHWRQGRTCLGANVILREGWRRAKKKGCS